jgi:hypothetical protein
MQRVVQFVVGCVVRDRTAAAVLLSARCCSRERCTALLGGFVWLRNTSSAAACMHFSVRAQTSPAHNTQGLSAAHAAFCSLVYYVCALFNIVCWASR